MCLPFMLSESMGKHILIKPEPVNIRGICITCNTNLQRNKGNGKYSAECQKCHYLRIGRHTNSKMRKTHKLKQSTLVCAVCGFIAQHECQIDLDHIDGNHQNNDPSNLQTLCANCHRLKTYRNKDWEIKSPPPFHK